MIHAKSSDVPQRHGERVRRPSLGDGWCSENHCGEQTEDLTLVLSEQVTNATQHGEGRSRSASSGKDAESEASYGMRHPGHSRLGHAPMTSEDGASSSSPS